MPKLEKLHPLNRLLFFLITLVVPLSFFNPYFSLVSLLCAVLYSFSKNGRSAFKTVLNSFLIIFIVGLFNMLFAHWGSTALFTVKETVFSLEPLLYGLNQGVILAAVLIWFTALGRCLDSESVIYLFRFSPKLALIFSMVLGFIPRFITKSHDIRDARLALNGGNAPKTLGEKVRFTHRNFSALVSYSLESSVITSNSMQGRGYNSKAVRASRFKFRVFDGVFAAAGTAVAVFVFVQYGTGNIDFVFQPVAYTRRLSIPALAMFFIAEIYPFASEITENVKWKLLSAKM